MSPRSRFLLVMFAVALASMLVGTFDTWVRTRSGRAPLKSVTDPAGDPRFRRVTYRQDELLDVPVLAEAFRIVKAKCFVGDCKMTDDERYQALFSEGFIVVERTDGYTVVFSRLANLPQGERGWIAPRIVDTTAFSWSDTQPMEETDRTVEYQTPALAFTFAKVGDRLTLTDIASETNKGTSGLSLGSDFVSLSYFPLANINAVNRVTNEKTVAERMANARKVLEEVRQKAIAADPDAPQLKTRTLLEWLPADHACGCDGQTWVDGNGNRRVDIGIGPLMSFSDNRLRRLFGHELGHIARCMQGDVTCQDAAEAHALKLMGPELYRRAHTIAEHESEESASKLIAKLEAVNKKYPGK